MAITLNSNNVTFNDGSVQTSGDKLVNVTVSSNSSRNASISISNQILWSHTFERLLSNSDIRVTSQLPGTSQYCYPFYGTYCELVNPSGGTYRSYVGSNYIHSNPNAEVNFYNDYLWSSSELNNQTGTWTVRYGWANSDGGGCKIFNTWNYNSSDDGRAFQQGSTSIVKEYK
jgi:hypothetical protein